MSGFDPGQGVIVASQIGRFVPICDVTPANKKRTLNVRLSNIRADNASAKVQLFISRENLDGVLRDFSAAPTQKAFVYAPKVTCSAAGPIDETAVVVHPGYRVYLVSDKDDVVFYAAGFQEDDA